MSEVINIHMGYSCSPVIIDMIWDLPEFKQERDSAIEKDAIVLEQALWDNMPSGTYNKLCVKMLARFDELGMQHMLKLALEERYRDR